MGRLLVVGVMVLMLLGVASGAFSQSVPASKENFQKQLNELMTEGTLAGSRLDVAKLQFQLIQEKLKALNKEITGAGFIIQQNPDGKVTVAETPKPVPEKK
jgi:hypothetical protein